MTADELRALLREAVATAPAADPFVRDADSGLAPGTIRMAIKRGELTRYRVGRDGFLARREVADFIARRRVVREVPPGDEVDIAIARKNAGRGR
jgi:hypothetical protein